MGSVGGWLSAAVTLCVFVIFHKLSGHEAKPSEPASERASLHRGESGRATRDRERERDGREGKASRGCHGACHMTGSNRGAGDSAAIRPRARLQSDC